MNETYSVYNSESSYADQCYILSIRSGPTPSLPESHIAASPAFPWPIPFADPPKVDRNSRYDERHNYHGLHRLRDHCSTYEEEAYTAEDDWRCYPSTVRSFEVRLPDAKNDQSKNGSEVERISCNTVESDQRLEFTQHDVYCRYDSVKHEAVDWGIPKPDATRIAQPSRQEFGDGGPLCKAVHTGNIRLADANIAEESRNIAFPSCDIDEATRGESRCVKGAEAACPNSQGENECSNGAKDLGAELHSDCIGLFYRCHWKDEKVCYVRQDVCQDDDRHCGVNDSG